MTIGTYVASKSGLLCLTFDSWLQGHILCQNLDFFASLLIHNYRDIYCVKFWTFLPRFWFMIIGTYLYCVKFWTFLPHFWFITIRTYIASNSGLFCLTFERKSIALLHRLTQGVQRANLRRTAGDPTWVFFFIDENQFRSTFFVIGIFW